MGLESGIAKEWPLLEVVDGLSERPADVLRKPANRIARGRTVSVTVFDAPAARVPTVHGFSQLSAFNRDPMPPLVTVSTTSSVESGPALETVTV
jgi:hypothetical protein